MNEEERIAKLEEELRILKSEKKAKDDQLRRRNVQKEMIPEKKPSKVENDEEQRGRL
jgi:hypothetical protein